jgi:predicted nucleotidyltransferase
MQTTETFSLKKIVKQLTSEFPAIKDLYLFGSRAYKTRSPRSDIDILVVASKHIRPNELRQFSQRHCPALDLFLVDSDKAVSCMNESFVKGTSFNNMVRELDAIHFWSRAKGFHEVDIDWDFDIPLNIEYVYTSLSSDVPVPSKWAPSLDRYFGDLEKEGYPISPFVGDNLKEISKFLIILIKNMIAYSQKLNKKGKGIIVELKNEYDFQNLFFLVIKPWLPQLAKEELTGKYDGQKKTADFSLCKNQIVIEMKHIKDSNTKAAIIKTLGGLREIYESNSGIKVIIFAILVNKDVALDDEKIEKDYSHVYGNTEVITQVIRNI